MKFASSAILATLALAACGSADEIANDTNTLAVEQAPGVAIGSGALTLSIDGGLVPGEEIELNVSGATPGEVVLYVVGTAESPGFACPPSIAPECADVENPLYINFAVANGLGDASLTVTVPPIPADGFSGFFQAFTRSPVAATSNIVQKVKRNDVSAPFHVEGFYLGDILTDSASGAAIWDGVFFRDFVRDTDDAILCSAGTFFTSAEFAGATQCVDCEFAFDVTTGTDFVIDDSVPGDCEDFIGVNENFFAWFDGNVTSTWGLDADYYVPGGGGATAPYLFYYDEATATWGTLGQTYYNAGFWGFGLIYNGTFYY